MAYLLSILAALACPIGMGLMMWLMMRGGRKQDTGATQTGISTERPEGAKRTLLGSLCLDWKVVAGLALVGLGIWVVAPTLVWAALPVLVVLACPISMLLMMRGMGGAQCAVQPEPEQRAADIGDTATTRLAALHVQREEIAREIDELEAARGSMVQDIETLAPSRTLARTHHTADHAEGLH